MIKDKSIRADPGKFIVVLEDPYNNIFGVLSSLGNVDKEKAMEYAMKRNAERRSTLDCVFWVIDDTGKCVNPNHIIYK